MENLNFYDSVWQDDAWNDMATYAPISRHRNRWILKMLKMLPIKISSLADIGCGNGKLLNYIAKNYKSYQNYMLFGTDVAQNSIEGCSKLFPNGVFKAQNLNEYNPNLFNATVDVSICSEVLEHLEDDMAAIKTMAKFSKYIIITVPAGPIDDMAKSMGHIRHYSIKDLSDKVINAGFKVEFSKSWGGPFAYPIYSRLRNKVGNEFVTGKYGFKKKFISKILYYIFYLNDLFNFGNKTFLIASNNNLKRDRHG